MTTVFSCDAYVRIVAGAGAVVEEVNGHRPFLHRRRNRPLASVRRGHNADVDRENVWLHVDRLRTLRRDARHRPALGGEAGRH